MKEKIYNFWEGFSIFFSMCVALPSFVIFPVLYFNTDVFEYLYEMEIVTFVITILLLLLLNFVTVATIMVKYQMVALFIFLTTIVSYSLIVVVSTTDDVAKLAKSGSILNMIVEPEYESLLKAEELNLSENELSYIHASSYRESFKGVLIDDDNFKKNSERNIEIRFYCSENNLHCYMRDTQTNEIYTLNQSVSKEAYEKIDAKFSFNIFKN